LNNAHDGVDGGSHVVGLESADEAIEACTRWTDSEEERDLNEDENEPADAGEGLAARTRAGLEEPESVQQNHTPEDDDVEVEDVGDPEGEAEDYAYYAGPGALR